MSTMTSTSTERRLSTSSASRPISNKPVGVPLPTLLDHTSTSEAEPLGHSSSRHPSPNEFPLLHGTVPGNRWQPRKDDNLVWGNGQGYNPGPRHGRQKSLSDAFKTIRTRRASVSANAHEIADALKAPVSVKLIVWVNIKHAAEYSLNS